MLLPASLIVSESFVNCKMKPPSARAVLISNDPAIFGPDSRRSRGRKRRKKDVQDSCGFIIRRVVSRGGLGRGDGAGASGRRRPRNAYAGEGGGDQPQRNVHSLQEFQSEGRPCRAPHRETESGCLPRYGRWLYDRPDRPDRGVCDSRDDLGHGSGESVAEPLRERPESPQRSGVPGGRSADAGGAEGGFPAILGLSGSHGGRPITVRRLIVQI